MRVAVITPYHDTPVVQFSKCCRSVTEQTVECTHFIIDDGSTPPLRGSEVIRLPHAHADTGNAARAIGSVSAICQGFDALAYLDSDNWYEPNHVETLLRLHEAHGVSVCSSSRHLYTPEGTLIGICPEVDGKTFVDTNCLMFTRAAFPAVAAWFMVPAPLKLRGDRFVWDQIVKNKFSRAHTGLPTVAYRTNYKCHYEHFGLPVPEGARELVVEDGRFVARSGD